ncbi:PREDICTED: uncharacterized protein LOC109115223 [Nelumbo nucifera]|uniref:Uncharacterized protein LOC109115223 n=1 Tax=Nelumbo nucifera TaxID=4432 RepID=A0A1U8Q6W5_NELNU|nr:PREDICTED: uncharacterized protein LOC109115223 [Nelumbo nucifera]
MAMGRDRGGAPYPCSCPIVKTLYPILTPSLISSEFKARLTPYWGWGILKFPYLTSMPGKSQQEKTSLAAVFDLTIWRLSLEIDISCGSRLKPHASPRHLSVIPLALPLSLSLSRLSPLSLPLSLSRPSLAQSLSPLSLPLSQSSLSLSLSLSRTRALYRYLSHTHGRISANLSLVVSLSGTSATFNSQASEQVAKAFADIWKAGLGGDPDISFQKGPSELSWTYLPY